MNSYKFNPKIVHKFFCDALSNWKGASSVENYKNRMISTSRSLLEFLLIVEQEYSGILFIFAIKFSVYYYYMGKATQCECPLRIKSMRVAN